MEETTKLPKSCIMFHKEHIIAYLSQKVCVWVRSEYKKVEGLVRGENVREVFVGVRGEIFYS